MIHAVRAKLAQSITASGSTFKTTSGSTIAAIPSPLITILAAGQLDGLSLGNTITGPDGQTLLVMAAHWHGDVCALTLVPQAILAQ